MKKRTIKKIQESQPDFDELRALGYSIHEFQPWHYRISHEDYDIQVDVWPTSRKIWEVDSYKKASVYNIGDLPRLIQRIFSKEDQMEEDYLRVMNVDN